MKKTFSVILILTILVGVTFSASANVKDEPYDIVKLKHQLMEKAKKMEALKNSKEIRGIKSISSKNKEEILLDMMIEGTDQSVIDKKMEDLGVYRLHIPKVYTTKSARRYSSVGSRNVRLDDPLIYYDHRDEEWIVTMGGKWRNNDWWDNANIHWNATHNDTADMGGKDAFGVGFTHTSGRYSTRLKRANAVISDNDGNKRRTRHRSDGDGADGFGFRLQDYVEVTGYPKLKVTEDDCGYIGKVFSGAAIYDKNFADYSGIATGYYIHTYDRAYVDSLKFGVSNSGAGIDVEIKNKQESFKATSSETRF